MEDTDILNIEEIVMGRGPPDPPAPPPTQPAVITFKPPPAPTVMQPSYQHENLQCFQCFITFCNSKAKERHMKKSHREEYKQQLQQGDTLFTCYVCDRNFLTSAELTAHQPTHSKEDKPFKCPHCQESFRTFSELSSHRRHVCPERQFVCKDCSHTFRTPALLRTHRIAQHPLPESTGVEEPLADPSKTEADPLSQQENHTGDQQCNGSASPKKPKRAPKSDDAAGGEKKGKKTKKEDVQGTEELGTSNHTEEAASVKVETKGKARGRPPKTAASKEAAAVGKPQASATAGKKTPEKKTPEKKTPEKKPKETPEKKLPCPECELTFPALALLRAHKKEKHTTRKPHPCEDCEESFVREEQLTAHKARVHTTGRFSCPTCGKSFGRESNMKNHMKSHPEEKKAGGKKR